MGGLRLETAQLASWVYPDHTLDLFLKQNLGRFVCISVFQDRLQVLITSSPSAFFSASSTGGGGSDAARLSGSLNSTWTDSFVPLPSGAAV